MLYNAGVSVSEFVSKSVKYDDSDHPLPGDGLTGAEIDSLLSI